MVSGMNRAEYFEHWSHPDCDRRNDEAADALTEWEIPNHDWTKNVPPIPNTYDPREDEDNR
jgi:hypothetical protein